MHTLQDRLYFNQALKRGLIGSEKATFIFINNFEVEEHWSFSNAVKLPSITIGSSKKVVNRMEELGVLLASSEDVVVLKRPLDSDYYTYLKEQTNIPRVWNITNSDPFKNITEDILSCSETIEKLIKLGKSEKNVFLMPLGVSTLEEKLSFITGIPLAAPKSEVFEKINSKVFSRKLNEKLGIKQIPGGECESIEELHSNFMLLQEELSRGGKLVLKESMGVSGKGIQVINSVDRFQKIVKLLENKSKSDNGSMSYVLEKWIEKKCDINYQLLIDRDGRVNFLGSKESIVEKGIHRGHIIPSRLTAEQNEYLYTTGNLIGKQLYKSGYFGIVGIDAILDTNNIIWPNLEINARLNMSTYQNRIQEEWISNDRMALAKHYEIKKENIMPFLEIRNKLGNLVFSSKKREGLLINNFATVNAGFTENGTPFKGRLYGIIIGQDLDSINIMDKQIESILNKV